MKLGQVITKLTQVRQQMNAVQCSIHLYIRH